MRPLSFLFAALLGVVLALIAPALAGPRPEAALPEATTLAWAAEVVAPEAEAPQPLPDDSSLAAEPQPADDALTAEEISRSILDTISALSDAA
ncbi:MAG: hypothetical protein VKK43_03480 [Synechococcaceae cyanobacterium]|nr:hypothetical protein [Synechococcaceae cyanobacterium]